MQNLENLLLAEPGPGSLFKVSDFGLFKKWGEEDRLETYVGTPVYMTPEVLGMGQMKEVSGYTYKVGLLVTGGSSCSSFCLASSPSVRGRR